MKHIIKTIKIQTLILMHLQIQNSFRNSQRNYRFIYFKSLYKACFLILSAITLHYMTLFYFTILCFYIISVSFIYYWHYKILYCISMNVQVKVQQEDEDNVQIVVAVKQQNTEAKTKPTTALVNCINQTINNIKQQNYFQQFMADLNNIKVEEDLIQIIVNGQKQPNMGEKNGNNPQGLIGKTHSELLDKQNLQQKIVNFQSQAKPTQRIQRIIRAVFSTNLNQSYFAQFLQNLQNLQNQQQTNSSSLDNKPTKRIANIVKMVKANLFNKNYFEQFMNSLANLKLQQQKTDQNELISHQKQIQQKKPRANKAIYNQNQFMEDIDTYNKLQQAKSYCNNLQVQFTTKLSAFDKTNPIYKGFFQTLNTVTSNKQRQYYAIGFTAIKNSYNFDTISERHQRISNKSFKKGENDDSFNLQLTLKSKNSKNFMYQSRQDSLVYSNATSFGLQSTSNKPLNFKNRQSSSQKQRVQSETQKDANLANMDRASSKGTIERDSSAKSLSDIERPIKLRKKQISIKQSKQTGRQSVDGQNRPKINTFMEVQPQGRKRVNTQNRSSQDLMNPHKKMSHKIIRADNFSQKSVFQSQIQTYQTKIAKIKQAKILKKKKLEDELAKINQQIQGLKSQEEIQNSPQNDKKSPKNTFQSRLKINNDQNSLKQAERLVKNLRSQKQNRLKSKPMQQPFDQNIHQHMQDIMKQRYLNQQRIKQKKQLQVIERMKKQEMRKIIEQKQKQASNQFLSKLKKSDPYRQNNGISNLGQHEVALKSSKVRVDTQQKIKRTPPKKTEVFQQLQGFSQTPQLSKKKAYLNKIRHFAIIKKPKQDLYQQSLN